jgi:tRNA(Ile)-lysidine synthase
MNEIVNKVNDTIKTHNLIAEGDKVLVGFSGGTDSVAMLHILHDLQKELKFSLSAAYIDHKLRPRAAKREERFCKEFCRKCSIPFWSEAVDIPKLSSDNKTGIEETARIYRYRTLERLADEKDCAKIAIGHHREDRAETIIFNLLRGSGRMGVAGIPAKRGRIIRPLYDLTRLEIADYLEDHGLRFMTDRSNLSRKFTRNRIRRLIIPLMKKEVSQAAVENIVRFSEIIADEENYLNQMTKNIHDKLVSTTPGGKIRLDLSHKLEYDTWLRRRLAFKILADIGFDDIEFAEVERIVALIDDDRQTRLSIRGGWMVETAGKNMYFYRPGKEIENYRVKVPGRLQLKFPRAVIDFEFVDNIDVKELKPAAKATAFIDADKIRGNLHVSGLIEGARFHPFGRPGSKKVGDFLTDCKYPRPLRDEIPVVYDDDGLVWLAGLEIDDRVKVTNETGKVIRIEIRKN